MYLLRDIERHLRQTGTAPSRFGREVLGDPAFVASLRRGREPRARTVDKVRTYLAERQSRMPEQAR